VTCDVFDVTIVVGVRCSLPVYRVQGSSANRSNLSWNVVDRRALLDAVTLESLFSRHEVRVSVCLSEGGGPRPQAPTIVPFR